MEEEEDEDIYFPPEYNVRQVVHVVFAFGSTVPSVPECLRVKHVLSIESQEDTSQPLSVLFCMFLFLFFCLSSVQHKDTKVALEMDILIKSWIELSQDNFNYFNFEQPKQGEERDLTCRWWLTLFYVLNSWKVFIILFLFESF